ncbi:class I SAM-dependent methyltransferase [Nocardioides sp. ChNu-153]|uniref:class I SAM-dependent methyltransferase n=1 Tax=unclassified Nocardioides TaxID=2615069 RepID=UPI002406F7FC|nr:MULTISPECIES: class I SAM-dependent methyltransferase [unclassified Nocardioides]MDF9716216.1 class I SAM-dependent methyltransferase [Nocardioides sp. ChNu-99]MDN7121606.1 class I SAM-dependent methyltransferase [Nocardioides sp. ChNu-153]
MVGDQVGQRCPSCGAELAEGFSPGPKGRVGARCGRCQALERHRFLALLLRALGPFVADAELVLDEAPSRHTTRVLADLGARRVVGMDFDPAADGRDVTVQGSLTQVPLATGSVDLLICYHVLEHVPNDAAAMAEIRRVLADDGIGLVQVPLPPDDVPTDEDPDADAETRIARFGQADHVRLYGWDVEDRLRAAGLDVVLLRCSDLVPAATRERHGLVADEVTWLVRPAPGAQGRLLRVGDLGITRLDLLGRADLAEPAHVRAARERALHQRVAGAEAATERWRTEAGSERSGREAERVRREAAEAETRAWRARAERAERSLDRLRSRLPVRAAVRVRRAARSVAGRLGGQS